MNIFTYLQVIISVLLISSILMQSRGTGLGSAWGGGVSTSYHSKRGLEKVLFRFTIVLAALFIIVSILALL
jgi:preprotein translocase subunit SecG